MGIERIIYPERLQRNILDAKLKVVVGRTPVLCRSLCGGRSGYFTLDEILGATSGEKFQLYIDVGQRMHPIKADGKEFSARQIISVIENGKPLLFEPTQTLGGGWCPFCDDGVVHSENFWIVSSNELKWKGSTPCPERCWQLFGNQHLTCYNINIVSGSTFFWNGESVANVQPHKRRHIEVQTMQRGARKLPPRMSMSH